MFLISLVLFATLLCGVEASLRRMVRFGRSFSSKKSINTHRVRGDLAREIAKFNNEWEEQPLYARNMAKNGYDTSDEPYDQILEEETE